jgi:AcrR family transcriptional regulator
MATVSRRDSILEAARREFAQAGYAGGRIERISASAKVNKQLIFHYFRSKDGLYAAVVQAAVFRLKVPADPSASPPDALRATVQSIVCSMDTDDMLVAAVVDCAIRGGVPGEARTLVANWVSGTMRLIGEVVATSGVLP